MTLPSVHKNSVPDTPKPINPICLKPGFFAEALDVIENGGSILQFCTNKGLKFSDFGMYVSADEARFKLYNDIKIAREGWYAQRLLDELNGIALVDIKDAFYADGRLKPIDEIPENIRRTMAGIEVCETFEELPGGKKVWNGYIKKVKLTDKLKAIEMLGKHVKFFVEELRVVGKVEHVHRVDDFDLEERIKALAERRTKPIDVSQDVPRSTVEEPEEAVIIEKSAEVKGGQSEHPRGGQDI